jgi:phosphocarrier protein HPr
MLLHTRNNSGTVRILITLRNKVGLHSRPAGAFVRVAKKYRAEIRISRADKEADGKKILEVLSLEAEQGALVTIEAAGEDAQQAVESLRALIIDNFGEAE